MMDLTVPASPPPKQRQPMRWIAWNCDECKKANRTRTRTGSKMTCPSCGHIQLGEEAKREQAAKLARIQARQQAQSAAAARRPSAKPVRVRGDPPPAPAPTVEAAPSGATVAPPAPVPPPAPRPLLDRLLGYA
jgi:hypothetical protein